MPAFQPRTSLRLIRGPSGGLVGDDAADFFLGGFRIPRGGLYRIVFVPLDRNQLLDHQGLTRERPSTVARPGRSPEPLLDVCPECPRDPSRYPLESAPSRGCHPGAAARSFSFKPADRQDTAAQRNLAGHGDVPAHRDTCQDRDDRGDHGDAGRRSVLGGRALGHVHVDVPLLEGRWRDAEIDAPALLT